MRVKVESFDIETSDNFETSEFKFNNNAFAFKILSEGIYQDKVQAVIREISTNAIDAHMMAEQGVYDSDGHCVLQPIPNRSQKPIEVWLPTELNPIFKVRDFGVGLTDDQVKNIYTTYFESTKRETDDQIGCFGLGSKSPFAISTTFTVVSYYNGVKTIWTAVLGAKGLPEIAKLATSPTDEENGVEVSIPVSKSYIPEFLTKANTVYSLFPVTPIVHTRGFDASFTKTEFADSEYSEYIKIQKNNINGWGDKNKKTKVVYGHIGYSLDYEIIRESSHNKDERFSTMLQILISSNMTIFPKFGAISITPSREVLSYDKTTLDYIYNLLIDIYENSYNFIVEKISEFKYPYELRNFYVSSYNNPTNNRDPLMCKIIEELIKKNIFGNKDIGYFNSYDMDRISLKYLNKDIYRYLRDDIKLSMHFSGYMKSLQDSSNNNYTIDISKKNINKIIYVEHLYKVCTTNRFDDSVIYELYKYFGYSDKVPDDVLVIYTNIPHILILDFVERFKIDFEHVDYNVIKESITTENKSVTRATRTYNDYFSYRVAMFKFDFTTQDTLGEITSYDLLKGNDDFCFFVRDGRNEIILDNKTYDVSYSYDTLPTLLRAVFKGKQVTTFYACKEKELSAITKNIMNLKPNSKITIIKNIKDLISLIPDDNLFSMYMYQKIGYKYSTVVSFKKNWLFLGYVILNLSNTYHPNKKINNDYHNVYLELSKMFKIHAEISTRNNSFCYDVLTNRYDNNDIMTDFIVSSIDNDKLQMYNDKIDDIIKTMCSLFQKMQTSNCRRNLSQLFQNTYEISPRGKVTYLGVKESDIFNFGDYKEHETDMISNILTVANEILV